jgi:uronate dehydrogenase
VSGQRVAVTGAAGSLAGDVLPGLAALGHRLTGIDRLAPPAAMPGEWVQCSVNDRTALRSAFDGVDAVIHLAGIPLEASWESLLATNIDGTQAVLETARQAGVGRVVLASSIHAAGYVPVPSPGERVPDDVPVRPNTFYGVSKAALEALGSLYHDRYGLDVICLRIASRFARPRDERMLSTWLSPADAVRLLDACLRVPSPGFRIIWGVSANTRGYLSSAGGESIGFAAQDDAEQFADGLLQAGRSDDSVPARDWDRRWIGGVFSSAHPPMYQPRPAPDGMTADDRDLDRKTDDDDHTRR